LAPAVLARRRIVASGDTRAALLVPPAAREDFAGVDAVDERPDWVVVGDLGPGFTWDVMNRAFGWLVAGSRLLALHKNPFWHAGERGLVIDGGAFVAALEYAASVTAEVVGKPSRGFFDEALEALGLAADQVLVVGDDPVNDAAGGAAAGCRTALVRTGKFSEAALARSGVTPDLILDSLADLGVG
jgi:HAD superfamily hydrolase (TIGR01458 family)